MEKIAQLVFENIRKGKIEKQLGAEILTLLKEEKFTNTDEMAIVGMSGRFPGARDIDQYWEKLKDGADCITPFPEARRRDVEGLIQFTYMHGKPYHFCEGGYLEEIDKFDYSFFNISPKEASLIDPNQRLFLETAWNALEDGGYGGKKLLGSKTGLYIGYDGWPMYGQFVSYTEPDSFSIAVAGNISAILASRIPHALDLNGPSMLIDTACSSSLVALHLACKAIRNGDCQQAIVGGIHLILLPINGMITYGIESPDFRARAFDDGANGTSLSEGVAAVLIKPLPKALEDGDHIYAVIKGSAINQDGSSMGITAPNAKAQEEVITAAWKESKIDPATISYIETHGTGTKLGDPIEVDGICKAFRQYTDKKQFCAIGSVKTNIGHLDNTAGLAGLVKAILALGHKKIPPSLHFTRPNRQIDFENSPVYVCDRLRPWESEQGPRRCGVSSFGFSGTNCHVVLEESPSPMASPPQVASKLAGPTLASGKSGGGSAGDISGGPSLETGRFLLVLSAKSESALQVMIDKYSHWTHWELETRLGAICKTANTGRGHYNYRLALLFSDGAALGRLFQTLRDLSGLKTTPGNGVFYGYHKIVSSHKENREPGELTEAMVQKLSHSANEKLQEYLQTGKTDPRLLEEISSFYIQGADLDWEALYRQDQNPKVRLPGYPFEPKRCWLTVPQAQELEPLFYETVWVEQELPPAIPLQPSGAVLIFKETDPQAERLATSWADAWRAGGGTMIEVTLGHGFSKQDNHQFVVGSSEEDYHQLFSALSGTKLAGVIHLGTVTSAAPPQSLAVLQDCQRRGIISLFYLVKALSGVKYPGKLPVMVIAPSVYPVSGQEAQLRPENAPLLGLCKVIPRESANLGCRYLDIDDSFTAAQLAAEWASMRDGAQNPPAAYRNGKRYQEEFRRLELEKLPRQEFQLKSAGVYLITGGTGGIGPEIGKYLASQEKINLAFISRSMVPDRSQWETILESGPDPKLKRRIEAWQEIEARGARIAFRKADVADEAELGAVLGELRSQYGRINGVIHCAGVAGAGMIAHKDIGTLEGVLAPKVRGAWLLDQLTREDHLDFMILFSSINSLAGVPGQSDYTAANAYLDALAPARNARGETTITINWAGWKETGMALEHHATADGIFETLTTATAIHAFDTILRRPLARVIIGALNRRLPDWERRIQELGLRVSGTLEPESGGKGVGNGVKPAPNTSELESVTLKGKAGGVYTETEKQMALIWKQVLGFTAIDINDNFFEIGGDSLLIAKVHELIEDLYPGKILITDFFAYPTIFKLAEYLDSLSQPTPDETPAAPGDGGQDMMKLFQEVAEGKITAAQADGIIAGWKKK